MPTAQLPGPIAVIDVETTGLFPSRHNRVLEVAAVVIQGDGRVVREFATLVNPGRDVGASSVHGLTAEDILPAPQFGEIAAQLVQTLKGVVAIGGHNIRFDQEFVESEFSRLGCPIPQCFTICTMQLSGGGRLADCCADYGVSFEADAHHALNDARATARLLSVLLPDQSRLVQKLSRLMPIEWPAISTASKSPITRSESRRRQNEAPSFLQRLLGRRHATGDPIATDGAIMEYAALLDRVLEDRRVDGTEADALLETAERWGLSGEQVRLAHREYLTQLAMAAVADGVVTDAERRDLTLVSRLLGLETERLDDLLREAASKLASAKTGSVPARSQEENLKGKRVCFTGELLGRYNGELISRELAEQLAQEAGLIVMGSVTKKLDLLVIADPHTQSGKAKKARQYGIRIMHEPVFWNAVGLQVE